MTIDPDIVIPSRSEAIGEESALAGKKSVSAKSNLFKRKPHGQNLLRQRCRPEPHPQQTSGHHRLRLARACSRTQPERERCTGQGWSGPEQFLYSEG